MSPLARDLDDDAMVVEKKPRKTSRDVSLQSGHFDEFLRGWLAGRLADRQTNL